MEPKPKGWSRAYGGVFAERSVVDRYHLRPPYPPDALDLLSALARGRPVIEAGCGIGELARRLAPRVRRVDAVDVSEPMVEHGRGLAGGDVQSLRWIVAAVEEAPLDPPYGLVVAGESIHWFDWDIALPRFAAILEADGLLALVRAPYRRSTSSEPVATRISPATRATVTELRSAPSNPRLSIRNAATSWPPRNTTSVAKTPMRAGA